MLGGPPRFVAMQSLAETVKTASKSRGITKRVRCRDALINHIWLETILNMLYWPKEKRIYLTHQNFYYPIVYATIYVLRLLSKK
jgi:hypothetical protein